MAVEAALAGRDVLVVMPTGSGKSLCYQLPALMRADLTLVVSPLVSLMQDQVEALERVAPGRVALVNAQQDAATNRRAVERAVGGRARILYVAPERFSSPGFLERIRHARIGLFVVDEAHCVSQWGHDFRPDYFRLADAARWLGAQAIVASTATATPQVAADIVARLGLRDPVHVATGFDRPNLSFAVVPSPTKEAAHRGISAVLAEEGALPAIVYAGTRAECDKLSARLSDELGRRGARLPRGHAARGARGGPAAVHGRGGARRRGHQRVRDGRRQGRRADGLPRVRAGLARGLLPGGRPRRPRRAPGPLPAVRLGAGQGAARLLHRARDGRGAGAQGRGAPRCSPPPSAAAGASTCRSGRWRPRRAATTRSCARSSAISPASGVVQPAPAPPDRVLGRVTGAWDGRALALCRSAAQEGTRARWRQYRAVWAWVDERRCRREGILRHFGDTSAPGAGGPVLRRVRSRPPARPAARPPRWRRQPPARAPPRGRGRRRRAGRGHRRGRGARPPVARPHPRRRGAARRALEGPAEARLGRAPPLRHLRPPERHHGARARATRCCTRAHHLVRRALPPVL